MYPNGRSNAVPQPQQTGTPTTIKPRAGHPNTELQAVGPYPPPSAVNVVQTNFGRLAIGTFLECKCGWSAGETSRLQAWVLKSRDVGNEDGLLQLLKQNPTEAMKYATDLGYKMKMSWDHLLLQYSWGSAFRKPTFAAVVTEPLLSPDENRSSTGGFSRDTTIDVDFMCRKKKMYSDGSSKKTTNGRLVCLGRILHRFEVSVRVSISASRVLDSHDRSMYGFWFIYLHFP